MEVPGFVSKERYPRARDFLAPLLREPRCSSILKKVFSARSEQGIVRARWMACIIDKAIEFLERFPQSSQILSWYSGQLCGKDEKFLSVFSELFTYAKIGRIPDYSIAVDPKGSAGSPEAVLSKTGKTIGIEVLTPEEPGWIKLPPLLERVQDHLSRSVPNVIRDKIGPKLVQVTFKFGVLPENELQKILKQTIHTFLQQIVSGDIPTSSLATVTTAGEIRIHAGLPEGYSLDDQHNLNIPDDAEGVVAAVQVMFWLRQSEFLVRVKTASGYEVPGRFLDRIGEKKRQLAEFDKGILVIDTSLQPTWLHPELVTTLMGSGPMTLAIDGQDFGELDLAFRAGALERYQEWLSAVVEIGWTTVGRWFSIYQIPFVNDRDEDVSNILKYMAMGNLCGIPVVDSSLMLRQSFFDIVEPTGPDSDTTHPPSL